MVKMIDGGVYPAAGGRCHSSQGYGLVPVLPFQAFRRGSRMSSAVDVLSALDPDKAEVLHNDRVSLTVGLRYAGTVTDIASNSSSVWDWFGGVRVTSRVIGCASARHRFGAPR